MIKSTAEKKRMHPAVMMLGIVFVAMIMTFVLPSGKYTYQGKVIIPHTYTTVEKHITATSLLSASLEDNKASQASPVGIADALQAVPQGIAKQSALIFMVLFIGGMFGILNKTGAIEAGLERTVSLTQGNIYVLIPLLMIVFSIGSTFMGLAKEYLLVIPMVIALTQRLGYPSILGLAIVAVPVKVGYLASITNPYALSIAQPLLGLPIFSGLSLRIVTYAVMMVLGCGFVLCKARHSPKSEVSFSQQESHRKLSTQHGLILTVLAVGIVFMVYATGHWKWKTASLSAYYLFLSILFAFIARLRPSETTEAFLLGMKKVLVAAVLIGLATAVEIVLSQGQILDTIIHYLVDFIGTQNAYVSSYAMFFSQLALDIAIPSTSGQAAVTMPIMGPVGQLSGVSPQTTVLAFLMGNGLTNLLTPTSSGLLIFLATAQIAWTQWAKFIFPLAMILLLACLCILSLAVFIGY